MINTPMMPFTPVTANGPKEAFRSHVQSVRGSTAADMCFGMMNSPPDSRRCLRHRVELSVAMSHYPRPTNGRRRQIIHLPRW